MAGDIIMCHLIMQDATNRPDLFKKSANIYVRFAESEIEKHNNYIQKFDASMLADYRQVEPEATAE